MKPNLQKLKKVGYDVFKSNISNRSNKNLFKTFSNFCKFYCPSMFSKKYNQYWNDKKFSKELINLRAKDKKVFAAIYNSFARSSELYNFCYSNNLHKLAANILKIKEKYLGIRDPILRIDVPQVKPNSHNILDNVSYLKNAGGKFKSKQYLIKNKHLKKFKTKSINVKANNVLATYANLFHKSGDNLSSIVRFTIIVRFYRILTEDFVHYRENKKNIISLEKA